jgi:prepilin-type N-terminal cleavage/methylation domain-containing protein
MKSNNNSTMLHILQKRRSGFTLVEIMIVVAIIALLAAIAVPNFLRARKRSQATRILEDLRLIDAAIDQYAIECAKATGNVVAFSDVKNFLKFGTILYTGGPNNSDPLNVANDLLGNPYGPFTVDAIPKVPASTYTVLSDVADNSFWSPYY